MNPTALIVHGGYKNVELGLLKNGDLIDHQVIHKHQASRDILSSLDVLLNRNSMSLAACTYIAAHQGPGPFTTLRVILASVNGLAFATKIPLVGVDGLEAFIEEHKTTVVTRYLVVALNAFSDDVYFAVYDTQEKILQKGCESIEKFVTRLKPLLDNPLQRPAATLYGNGIALHHSLLEFELADAIIIAQNQQDIASLSAIAQQAVRVWKQQIFSDQLLPLYLKDSSRHMMPETYAVDKSLATKQ